MSNINQSYSDRVRYTIQNRHIDSIIIPEPIGWNDDGKEYDRDEKYNGIFVKLSNSLKFIDEGYETLKFLYEVYGINEDVRLIKDFKHPKTDIWTRRYDGYLDMSTYKEEDKQISVKFNSGGLEAVLKARESEAVEITRDTTIDGKSLTPLVPKIIELEGRKIFLKSLWDIKESDNSVYQKISSDSGNTRSSVESVPLRLINKSHVEAQNVIYNSSHGESVGNTASMFFANSESSRELRIKFNLSFIYNIIRRNGVSWSSFKVCLSKYGNGTNYDLVERIDLMTINGGGGSGQTYNVFYDEIVEIEPGESLALEFFIKADFRITLNSEEYEVRCSDIVCDLFIEEDSYFEKTTSNFYLPHEFVERLIEIYTGRKALYSNALGRVDLGYEHDGVNSGALNALLNGFDIRNFNSNDEVYKPITTSLKDFMESFSTTWNLGLGIEKIGLDEVVRIEDLSYFYNRNTTIKLPNPVKKVKRSISSKHFFSSIEIGFEKGGNYEEAFGLVEYNGQSRFTTIFTRYVNKFSKLSKYRADSYGLEFCRRKQKETHEKEDTQYDTDIFKVDAKRGLNNDSYFIRKWEDDFEIEPQGTFSPETAYNLRLTPFNCMLRHGWELSAGLTKNSTEYIRYASSTANSALKTKLIGKPEYSENGNIINSELTRARYIPEIIEFEHEVTFEISQKLEGTSIIMGKEIPNMYGCIEFENENGEIEKGFLLNLKPNKQGKWKLLKVY